MKVTPADRASELIVTLPIDVVNQARIGLLVADRAIATHRGDIVSVTRTAQLLREWDASQQPTPAVEAVTALRDAVVEHLADAEIAASAARIRYRDAYRAAEQAAACAAMP